ncbi:AraC family transcriptional regulator with amidase-like domain [Tahibacter aquaticus]|uniref:AraC family transcriptional regulator with amidase-like domain n=1 Tax=Tahibacter aquaticus TaxID=520092 RepID=A0A4R6YVD0_9GAMM|nr:GlxA family transcriptional regulator [Tahibacter aquaticus]TDR42454.1 AraC family transcriptional regulator with amidase-like domain [Tahibacter aquaticus]
MAVMGGLVHAAVMATSTRTRRIGFVVFENFNALDLTGPLEVFAAANDLAQEQAARRARPLYEAVILGPAVRVYRAESGVAVKADVRLAASPPLDTVLMPGGHGIREPATLRRLAAWLQQQGRVRRIASVCTGAYALAEAGLLDGCRVSTHWRHAQKLAQRYPALQVDADAIFLHQGRCYTSAGISAGIDLALALLAEDHGSALALAVARELVVPFKRDGGQKQYSDSLAFQTQAGDRLGELSAWMLANLAQDLSLPRLAQRACVSPRQLSRRFQQAFGLAPAAYVEKLRVEQARQRLSESRASIARVAAAVGFRSADVFRRAFERRVGVNPATYRARFGAALAASST